MENHSRTDMASGRDASVANDGRLAFARIMANFQEHLSEHIFAFAEDPSRQDRFATSSLTPDDFEMIEISLQREIEEGIKDETAAQKAATFLMRTALFYVDITNRSKSGQEALTPAMAGADVRDRLAGLFFRTAVAIEQRFPTIPKRFSQI